MSPSARVADRRQQTAVTLNSTTSLDGGTSDLYVGRAEPPAMKKDHERSGSLSTEMSWLCGDRKTVLMRSLFEHFLEGFTRFVLILYKFSQSSIARRALSSQRYRNAHFAL